MAWVLSLDTLSLVTSNDEAPIPLPGPTVDRSAAYHLLVRDLLPGGRSATSSGAARAGYRADVSLAYQADSASPTARRLAEYEAVGGRRERYHHIALRRFVTATDLDVRRCLLPGLPLDERRYPAELRDQVGQAVRIVRTSSDDHLRRRVEIRIPLEPGSR